MGFFDRLKGGLAKTKNAVLGQVDSILKSFVKVDEDLLEELEEILICADMGFETTEEVMDELREKDDMKMTPSERLAFFFSGAFGNKEVIEEFIEKGFDASLKDSTGKTIFDIAGIYGNEDILNWRSQQ
jgi:fused signal recognition particle receptor